jgi:CubicO group peptidase (beta-lactamase class C family)
MTELREGSAADAGMLPERIERVRALAKGWVEQGHTPSLVVLAARRGVIVLNEAFGKLRPEPVSPPLRADSIFAIGSISKTITATAAMVLVEDGVLGLNRPIRDYLPEVCGKGSEEVLVHHLLSHTSGYNDDLLLPLVSRKLQEGFGRSRGKPSKHHIVDTLLSVCYPAPLWKPAGTQMAYCTLNYDLLGEVVERVSGRPLADFAQERIFGPLGMKDSYYVVPGSARPRILKYPANSPFAGPAGWFPGLNSREFEEMPWASGGAYSTAMDLAIFGQMFLNGGMYGGVRILSRPTVEAMTRNQIPGIGAQMGATWHGEASWGYGWQVECEEKWKYFNGSLLALGTFSHWGIGGSALWIDPADEIVGVYMEVTMRITELLEHIWNCDLFQNVVSSAVAE